MFYKKGAKLLCIIMALIFMMLAFCGCNNEKSGKAKGLNISSASDLGGKKVAICQGTIHDQLILELAPTADLKYYSSYADMLKALDTYKIDAFVGDTPCFKYLIREANADCTLLPGELYVQEIGAIFANTENGQALCQEYNAFLASLKESGELKKLQDKWIEGENETLSVTPDELNNTKGRVIHYAMDTLNPPFGYVKDGQIVGYEVELAILFCKSQGYGIEISDTQFDSIIPGVFKGTYDFASSAISITEERKESVLFSDSQYKSGASIVIRTEDLGTDATLTYNTFDELEGKKIGVVTGTISSQLVPEAIKNVQVVEFSAMVDLALALENGKIDAYSMDQQTAAVMCNDFENQEIMPTLLREEDYAYILKKDDDKSEKLCAELNAFLTEKTEDGTLEEIKRLWLGGDEEAKAEAIDLNSLTGERGTLEFATSSTIGAPMSYILDGKNVGYDVHVAYLFCKENGYKMSVTDYDFRSLISSVAAGKADFGGSCITITEERAESVLFSKPNYSAGPCIVVNKATTLESTSNGLFADIGDSIDKTFFRENRWKLFVRGIGSTMLITVLSIIFGTALGFAVYMASRKGIKYLNSIFDFFSWLLQGMPTVVLLMILFYIIFAKSGLSGTGVAIVGFTLTFATSVRAMLDTGVAAIDKGQEEAALALGYSPTATFFKMILPQAVQIFLPSFKSEVVSLIKGTAVVGYIAVQDLTKMGDIVRSRTYEAFFPLIVTAIIYFILAGILTRIVGLIEIKVDPKKRDVSNLLKGVDKND